MLSRRTLYLPIIEPGAHHDTAAANKHGLRTALEAHGACMEWDYLQNDSQTLFDGLINRIEQFQPEVLFTQFHGANIVSADQMRDVRTRYPALRVLNWCGDVWDSSQLAPEMVALLREYDLALCVNGSLLEPYAAAGVRAAYWPFGYETPVRALPEVEAYDVLYLGTNYSDLRKHLGAILHALPYRTGIFGDGWSQAEGNCLYDFTTGHALYQNCRVTVSDNQFPDAKGYLSNRLFQALAAGAFVLQQRVAELQAFTGFIPGVHFIEFTALDELPALIDYWVKPEQDDERRRIADMGQRFCLHFHSFEARVDELFKELLPNALRERERA